VTVLVLALIGGTAAAFTVTEALKLEPPPVGEPRFDKTFSPTCGCPTRAAKLSFRLRRADRLDLLVVSGDEPVRTLARDLAHAKGRIRVRWDGRNDAGEIVPDGVYRLQVQLHDARRTVVIPRKIRVDTEAPGLEVLEVVPDVFSPDGDGRLDTIRIVYRTTEDAAPLVFVNDRPAVAARRKPAGQGDVTWDGRIGRRTLRAGAYTLVVRARDAAGNLSPAVQQSVEIRYIEVTPGILVARRGTQLRFEVVTDAESFSWTLRRRGGRVVEADARVEPGVVTARLPARIRPGRYILEVSANGHRDHAVVRVRRRS
jgi:hypothetical protein